MLCLNHSKAVLCEKPFALNSNQVIQMIALAKKKNVFLMEAMWTLFLPHFQHVLNIIQSKELGEIISLKADFGYQFDFDPESRVYNKSLEGGSLMDIGIYPVFAALSMLGVPESIDAKSQMSSTDVDENCDMVFYYKNGVEAILFSSVVEETKTEAIIAFERGAVHVHSKFHEPSKLTIITENGSLEKTFEVSTNGYSFEAEHVTKLLLKNKNESPMMTFDKSLNLMKLLDQIRTEIGLKYGK